MIANSLQNRNSNSHKGRLSARPIVTVELNTQPIALSTISCAVRSPAIIKGSLNVTLISATALLLSPNSVEGCCLLGKDGTSSVSDDHVLLAGVINLDGEVSSLCKPISAETSTTTFLVGDNVDAASVVFVVVCALGEVPAASLGC